MGRGDPWTATQSFRQSALAALRRVGFMYLRQPWVAEGRLFFQGGRNALDNNKGCRSATCRCLCLMRGRKCWGRKALDNNKGCRSATYKYLCLMRGRKCWATRLRQLLLQAAQLRELVTMALPHPVAASRLIGLVDGAMWSMTVAGCWPVASEQLLGAPSDSADFVAAAAARRPEEASQLLDELPCLADLLSARLPPRSLHASSPGGLGLFNGTVHSQSAIWRLPGAELDVPEGV